MMYADDTILISKDTRATNTFLAEVGDASQLYGLKLNTGKCMAITMNHTPNIHFKDGQRVKNVEEAIYRMINVW